MAASQINFRERYSVLRKQSSLNNIRTSSSHEMEKSEMKTDVAARSADSEAPARRNLYLAIGISLLAALCLIALLSSNEYPLRSGELVEVELNEEPQRLLMVEPPREEVRLMNYDDFLDTYRLAESMSELEFLSDMINIAQHNLATLAARATYYRRQSPFKLKLNDRYKDYTWSDLPLDLLGGLPAADRKEEEGFVSGGQPAELKKANPFTKWLQRLTKKEANFEIPNFPLDQQPDAQRITHIDADQRGCLGAPRRQGRCGACYAFSWLSLVEWHYCKQSNGTLADFSEQHIVDCGDVAHLKGCVEGKLSDTKDFTQVFHLHWEEDYPYTGEQSACKKRQGKVGVKVIDFRRINVEREEFEQTLREQPILLEVRLPEDITFYSSGIHPANNCHLENGHGMLLVGHGRQDGQPYWILRDSSGKNSAENGYIRMSRDMPDMSRCFHSAFVAKFKFKSLPEENYIDFYDSVQFEPALHRRKEQNVALMSLLEGN